MVVSGDYCHALLGRDVDEWLADTLLSRKNSGEKKGGRFEVRRGGVSCVVGGWRKAASGCLLVKAAAFVGCVARPVAVLLMGQ